MIEKVAVVAAAAAAADCGVLLMRGKICNTKDIQMVVVVGVNATAQQLLAKINGSSLCVVCCTELLLSKITMQWLMTLLCSIFPSMVDNIIL